MVGDVFTRINTQNADASAPLRLVLQYAGPRGILLLRQASSQHCVAVDKVAQNLSTISAWKDEVRTTPFHLHSERPLLPTDICLIRLCIAVTRRSRLNGLELRLSGRNLQSIPSELMLYGENLSSLSLSKNRLSGSEIDRALLNTRHLCRLDLSDNQLDHVPRVSTCKQLTYLDLSRNFIRSSDYSWQVRPNATGSDLLIPESLHVLNISENLIESSCPQVLAHLVSLKHLNLSSNNMRCSLEPLMMLSKLEHLDLGLNRLDGQVQLDPTKLSWPSLTWLSVASNTLSAGALSQILSNAPPNKLEYLNLSNCMNRSIMKGGIPEQVFGFTNLTSLDLSFNALKCLDRDVIASSRLTFLNLTGNRLKEQASCLLHKELSALSHAGSNLIVENSCEIPRKVANAYQGLSAARLGVGKWPSLVEQFKPLSTSILRRRLILNHRIRIDPRLPREYVVKALSEAIQANGGRETRNVTGILVPQHFLNPLLVELRSIQWPTISDRPSVKARSYIVIKRKVDICRTSMSRHAFRVAHQRNAKHEKYKHVWDLAVSCLAQFDTEFAQGFTDMALTKNFIASPHIDKYDVDAQYAMSLGDFGKMGGGELCVEESPCSVAVINTYMRLAKMDGRFTHWVSGYSGERFSIVFYRTEGPRATKMKAVHD